MNSNLRRPMPNNNNNPLQAYSYDRDLNWYFNAANIPNQDAVFATRDFIEEYRTEETSTIDFFNLLWRQKDVIVENSEKPFDCLIHLQKIPLSEKLRHTLYGMLIYWFGGNPEKGVSEYVIEKNVRTVLKLLNGEFRKQFPGQSTPERDFCVNEPGRKSIRHAMSHLREIMPKLFNNSDYLERISIDFEDLPEWVIREGILSKWDRLDQMSTTDDFNHWFNGWANFINHSAPNEHRRKVLEKGIEFGKKILAYHTLHECKDPAHCGLNEKYERMLIYAENALNKLNAAEESEQDSTELETRNPEFTTARQVLAIHFLLRHCSINPIDNPTEVARFAQLLTSRETGARRIQDTTLYKKVRSPFSQNDGRLMEDLRYIRGYFAAMNLTGIVAEIDKEIRVSENNVG